MSELLISILFVIFLVVATIIGFFVVLGVASAPGYFLASWLVVNDVAAEGWAICIALLTIFPMLYVIERTIEAIGNWAEHRFPRPALVGAASDIDPRVTHQVRSGRREWDIVDQGGDYLLIRDHGRRLLAVRDPHPGGQWYVLRVPPEMRTVEEAHAWTFNLSVDEYQRIEDQS